MWRHPFVSSYYNVSSYYYTERDDIEHAIECEVMPPYVCSYYYMCPHTATCTAVHNGVAEGGALEATFSDSARAEL